MARARVDLPALDAPFSRMMRPIRCPVAFGLSSSCVIIDLRALWLQQPEAGQHTMTRGELHVLAGTPPQQAEAPVQTRPGGHALGSAKQLWWQTSASSEP